MSTGESDGPREAVGGQRLWSRTWAGEGWPELAGTAQEFWHSPGSWESCPKRQKHLIIRHLSNESVTTPVVPACTLQHHETIVDFPVAPGAALQVSRGPARARLGVEPVGKGAAQNQESLDSNPPHTTYQLCDRGPPGPSLRALISPLEVGSAVCGAAMRGVQWETQTMCLAHHGHSSRSSEWSQEGFKSQLESGPWV